jgi:membrane fusion protein (multidrug efflux system)
VLLVTLAIAALAVVGARAYWRHQELHPSTDDALLRAHVLLVRPRVAGPVSAVGVIENQFVRRGELLFQIDPRPFQQAVDQAQAALVLVRADVQADRFSLQALASAVDVARSQVAAAQARSLLSEALWKDVQALAAAGEATPKEVAERKADLDGSAAALAAAQASLVERAASLTAAQARIGDAAYEQARIASATATLESAKLNLEYTSVTAPADGWVTQFDLRVGQVASPASTVFYFIEATPWWIEANFKETQVQRIKPGQRASFTVDMYPDRVFAGTVESLSRGAAAAFTLLPPENTTGNWVKVTQRIPVRIRVEDVHAETPFRKGASVTVTVDTTSAGSPIASGRGAASAPPGVRTARPALERAAEGDAGAP